MISRITLWVSVIFILVLSYFSDRLYEAIQSPRTSVFVNLATPRPIPIETNIWLENLTWMEIRDLINTGHDTVIVPTGGIEQNGPFVVTGKHNFIVAEVASRAATLLKNTLVAPVVKLVPQGSHHPPTGHMQYPGTLGLTRSTFESVIEEICLSLQLHGFKNIILIADSGGNLNSLDKVAAKMQSLGDEFEANVYHLSQYYLQDKWSYNLLKEMNINQIPDVQSAKRNDVHSDYHYEAMLAAIDPTLIRAHQRLEYNLLTVNGVSMTPIEDTANNGEKLIEYRVNILAQGINSILN